MPIAHAQFTCNRILPLFACDGCIRGAYRILLSCADVVYKKRGDVHGVSYLIRPTGLEVFSGGRKRHLRLSMF